MTFGLKQFGGVLGFTVIETVTLQLWIILAFGAAGISIPLFHPLNLLSVAVLFVGLLYEHVRAAITGKKEGEHTHA